MGWKDYIPFIQKEHPPKQPKLKICCACPETKEARDECIAHHGEDYPRCKELIEMHKQCLRREGFDV